MPFQSKAQMRWMYSAERRNELPRGTAARWSKETPSFSALPQYKRDPQAKTSQRAASRYRAKPLTKMSRRTVSARLSTPNRSSGRRS